MPISIGGPRFGPITNFIGIIGPVPSSKREAGAVCGQEPTVLKDWTLLVALQMLALITRIGVHYCAVGKD